jgi:c(7)-type cytochrome triheme protein
MVPPAPQIGNRGRSRTNRRNPGYLATIHPPFHRRKYMSKLWFFLVIILLFSLPAVAPAAPIGGMVFETYLRTKTVGQVLFDHTKHGAECNTCHPKIFKQKSNSNHASMEEMAKGRSCGACHNGKKAFSVTANCTTCHTEAGAIVFKNEDLGNVTFPHDIHLEMYGCGECHPDPFTARRGANRTTMAEMEQGKSCGACHDGSAAFSVAEDCESCHKN